MPLKLSNPLGEPIVIDLLSEGKTRTLRLTDGGHLSLVKKEVKSETITVASGGFTPTLPALRTGDTLQSAVPNWASIILAGNYESSVVGENLSVVVTYLGTPVDETTVLTNGDTAGYQIAVTGDQGSSRNFTLNAIGVTHVPPTVEGSLGAIEVQQGLGPQTIDADGVFGGEGLTFRIEPLINWITPQANGNLQFDSDNAVPQANTAITLFATNNSGVEVSVSTTFTILETLLDITGLTGGIADLDNFASIGGSLSNGRAIDAYSWGSTSGGSEYGIGSNPTAFTAGTLYLSVDAGVNSYSTSVTAQDLLKFDTQPAFGAASYTIGDTVTFTEGTASPSATISVHTFELDGVDKSGELTGLTWDSSGETAGTITLRLQASGGGQGPVLSDIVTVPLNAAAGAVPPIFNSIVLGVLANDQLPIIYDVSEDQPTPYTVHIGPIPVADSNPSPTQLQAGNGADDLPLTGYDSQQISADGQTTTAVGTLADGDYRIVAVIEDADGHLSDAIYVVGTITISSVTLEVDVLGGPSNEFNSIGNTSAQITHNISATANGEKLLVHYGGGRNATALSISGGGVGTITKISTDSAVGGTFNTVFEVEMTGQGSATAVFTFTVSPDSNHHVMKVERVRNGVIGTPVEISRASGGALLSGVVTPGSAPNYISACTISTFFTDLNVTWGGIDEIATRSMPTASAREISLAGKAGTTTDPVTVTFQPSEDGPVAIFAVPITQAP